MKQSVFERVYKPFVFTYPTCRLPERLEHGDRLRHLEKEIGITLTLLAVLDLSVTQFPCVCGQGIARRGGKEGIRSWKFAKALNAACVV